jgi:hypothetical protein
VRHFADCYFALMLCVIILIVVMLCVIMLIVGQCQYGDSCYAEHPCAECLYAERHLAGYFLSIGSIHLGINYSVLTR